jgi:hypothetical protein
LTREEKCTKLGEKCGKSNSWGVFHRERRHVLSKKERKQRNVFLSI